MAFHAEEMAAHAEEMALQPHDGTFQPEEMAFYAQSKLSHPAHLWRRLCRRGGSEEMAFQPEEMAFRTAPQSLMHGKSLELTHAAARYGFPTVPSPLSPLYFPAPERMRRGHCYSLYCTQ